MAATAAGEKRRVSARHKREPPSKKQRTPEPEPPPPPEPIEPERPKSPLPTKLVDGQPLPTIDAPQSDLGPGYQSIVESAVLATSLVQSRKNWVENVFEKFWSKTGYRKKAKEKLEKEKAERAEKAEKGQKDEDGKKDGEEGDKTQNPGKKIKQPKQQTDRMNKLGQATLTIEPHIFDVNIYMVKDKDQPQPQVAKHAALSGQHSYPGTPQRPHQPQQMPQTQQQTQQQYPTASPYAQQPQQARPQMPSTSSTVPNTPRAAPPAPPPAPSSAPPVASSTTPSAAPSSAAPAAPSVAPSAAPAPTPSAAPPPTPTPAFAPATAPITSPVPPPPSPSPQLKPPQQEISDQNAPKQDAPQAPPQHNTPKPSQPPNTPSQAKAPNPPSSAPPKPAQTPKTAPPSQPQRPATQPRPQHHSRPHSNAAANKAAPDPVIHMLAQRASTDPELKAVMKIVAAGNASEEQLKFFQRHITELTELLELRNKGASNRSTVNTTPQVQRQSPAQTKPHQPPAPSSLPATHYPRPQPQPGTPSGGYQHFPPHQQQQQRLQGSPYQQQHQQPNQPYNYYPSPQPARPPIPRPPPKPVVVKPLGPPPALAAVLVEFIQHGPDRFLFPRYSILETLPITPPGSKNRSILASFLLVRKGALAENPGHYKEDKEYYQPVTVRFDGDDEVLQCLYWYVHPKEKTLKYMEEVMDHAERAEQAMLALRLPKEDGTEAEAAD